MKLKIATLLLVIIIVASTFLTLYEVPIVKADAITDAISLGLDWLDRMTYCEINETHAVALESPSLSFRMKRSDGYWTIFGKKTDINLPPSATMIRGGCTDPQATTDDLDLIHWEIDNQRMKYFWDIDGDGEYDDATLYVEYATMEGGDNTVVDGKITQYQDCGVSLQLYLEDQLVMNQVSLNAEFDSQIGKTWGWAGRRYTIRPTTKGLADLYAWLGTTQFSWLGGQTYQQVRGIDYCDRALKLYRTWYGSGYIIDRFDGHYGATLTVRPYAGQYGIPNYPPNPDLILEPWRQNPPDYSTYYVDSPSSNWYSYANAPNMNGRNSANVLRHTSVSRHIMPENEEWPNCPFQCSDTQFIYAYKSRTGFEWARNTYISNGFEFDLINYQDVDSWAILPGTDVILGIGTDAKSIRACHDMYKYGANVPYGLSTLKTEFIDSATWDGNGIAFDSWRGTSLGWPYPAYGTHNTATYGNALIQYYKLTSDSTIGAKADEVIGVLLMLQNKLGQAVFSRSKTQSYYRAEFVGSFLPGYAVAYSFGQQDIYSAGWTDMLYGALEFLGIFEQDPQSMSYPCIGNAECTIPSVWTLIQYKTTGRTPTNPQQAEYTCTFQDNVVAYTDHGGSWGGDGDTEIVSQNLQSTYLGGDTGNLYRHTGKLDRIRMYAGGPGEAWASIQYEWTFTLANSVSNWRTKVYFTVPDYYGFRVAGENSLTVTASLYNSGGQLITEDSRVPIQNLHGNTRQSGTGGKMVVYNDMAKLDSLASGTYTVKLKFRVYKGGADATELYLGYIGDWSYKLALPMGLEYFGYDVGWYDNFDDNSRDTTKWDELQWNEASGAETGNALQVTAPSGAGQAGSGYVTTNAYNINGYAATVEIPEFDNLDEMILQICTTKTTNSDPFYQNSWYRILKNRYDNNIYIQSRISGGAVNTQVVTSWISAVGTLTISVVNGVISFYENGVLKYSESYALPSYNCYVYVFTSTLRERASGTDKFDNFGFAPTISGFSENEDFTTYTELDPNSHINLVGTNHIDATVTRGEDAYLYADKGMAHFGNFEHSLDVRIASSGSVVGGWISTWMLSNDIEDVVHLRGQQKTYVMVNIHRSSTNAEIYLEENYAGAQYSVKYNGAVGTWYYLTITKSGTSLTCKIYSDSARMNLLTTLSLTLHGDWTFRYIYAVNTHNDAHSEYYTNADIENLNLQEGGALPPPPTPTPTPTPTATPTPTTPPPTTEDFTTYTEVDPNNHIAKIGTNHVDAIVARSEDAYLYKDKGIGYFADFEHKIDVKLTPSAQTGGWTAVWMLTNDIDDVKGLRIASKTYLMVNIYHDPNEPCRIYLEENYAGAQYHSYYDGTVDTWYYLTITKAGTTLTCKIYSDSSRTTLITTKSLTLHGSWAFRYVFAVNTYNDANAAQTDVEIEKLIL